MKAKIVIQKGWKLLRFAERIQAGDHMLWGTDLTWVELRPAFHGDLIGHRCVIRPIPKAAKPSPKSQPTKRKAK